MSTTQPIKNSHELSALKNYYLEQKPNYRNYALINTGLNTALRISDLLLLQWEQVFSFETGSFRKHLVLKEKKTGKENRIALNANVRHGLALLKSDLPLCRPDDYIFTGRDGHSPLCRSQAFRIIKDASSNLHLSEQFSCHSLRKTFGYQAWTSGVSPAVLMILYNHSSFQVTKRYLGIEQDDKDNVFLTLNI